MSVIGDNIRKNRLKNNLTTRDLAQKIGVSHTAVNKFEKGLLSPNKQMIRKMARIFKVKTQKLVLDTSTLVDIKNIEFIWRIISGSNDVSSSSIPRSLLTERKILSFIKYRLPD